MPDDLANQIASDINEAAQEARGVSGERIVTESYTAKVLGNTYTVTAFYRVRRVSIPIFKNIKINEEVEIEVIADDSEVGTRALGATPVHGGEVRQAIWNAHTYYLDEGRFL